MKNYTSPNDKTSIYIAQRIEELKKYESDKTAYAMIKAYEDANQIMKAFCRDTTLTVEEALEKYR